MYFHLYRLKKVLIIEIKKALQQWGLTFQSLHLNFNILAVTLYVDFFSVQCRFFSQFYQWSVPPPPSCVCVCPPLRHVCVCVPPLSNPRSVISKSISFVTLTYFHTCTDNQ
jgi:hypothetical protein